MQFGLPAWLWWLVLGALIAWLIEWLIDWWYWRSKLKVSVEEWQTISSTEEKLRNELGAAQALARRTQDDHRQATLTYQTELDQLRGQISASQGELASSSKRLQERATELGAIRGQFETLMSQYSGAKGDLERLNLDLASATNRVRERDAAIEQLRLSLTGERDAARAELGTARSDIQRLQQEFSSLQSQHGEVQAAGQRWQAELGTLREQYSSAQDDIASLHGQLDLAQQERTRLQDDLAVAQARNGQVQSEAERLQAELADLRNQHGEAQAASLRWQHELGIVRGQFDGLKGEHQRWQDEFGALRFQYEGAQGETQRLHTELADLRNQHGEAQAAALRWQDQVTAIRAQFAGAQDETQQLQSEVVSLRSQYADMQVAGQRWQHELETVRAQLGTAQEENRRWQDELNAARGQLEDARNETQRMRHELAEAHDFVERIRNDSNRTQHELASFRQLIQGHETELARQKTELVAFAATSERLSSAQNEIARLQAEITMVDQTNRQLHAEIEQYAAELNKLRQKGDPLINVNGIGPVYQRKLNQAGIFSFAELSNTSADRLRTIIQPQDWQQIDFAAWINEAAILAGGGTIERERKVRQRRVFRAARDRFERIAGISADDEQRLWNAGILTFDQLSRRQAHEISAILGRAEESDMARTWVSEAHRLARLRAELVEYSFEADDPRRTVTVEVETETERSVNE